MEDIDLYKLLQYYAKRWLIILLLSLLGLAAAFAYNQVQTPMYRSDATMLLVNTNNVSPTQETVLLNNYVKLFSTRRVLEPVLKNGNYRMSYAELAGNVKATNDTNTELIRLSITNPSAPTSQKLVNDVVNSFRQQVKSLYNQDNISVVDTASRPDAPYNVRKAYQLVLGFMAGLLLALIMLFFLFDFSTSHPDSKLSKDLLAYRLPRPALRLKLRREAKKRGPGRPKGSTNKKTKAPAKRGPGRPRKTTKRA